LDSLDVRVYRELFHGKTGPPLESEIRKSYRSVAKRLKMDEVTIRNRVKKIQRSGFVTGLRLVVNPSLIGVRFAQLWFDVRPSTSKEDVIKELSVLPGAVAISDCYGSSMTLVMMCEKEVSATKEFELIARVSRAGSIVRANIPFPECSVKLTLTDWRIIKAIRADPRQSYESISGEVGVSKKTVRRRLDRMVEGKAVFVIPSLHPKALDGAMIADLVVLYASPESKADVDRKIVSRFDEFLIRAELGDPEHGFFNLIIRNIAKAAEISSWVREQPGVGRAFVELVQDRIELYDSFDDPIDRKVREATSLA
jgi:DNA-binding Lrp family transcriptional regulator